MRESITEKTGNLPGYIYPGPFHGLQRNDLQLLDLFVQRIPNWLYSHQGQCLGYIVPPVRMLEVSHKESPTALGKLPWFSMYFSMICSALLAPMVLARVYTLKSGKCVPLRLVDQVDLKRQLIPCW